MYHLCDLVSIGTIVYSAIYCRLLDFVLFILSLRWATIPGILRGINGF